MGKSGCLSEGNQIFVMSSTAEIIYFVLLFLSPLSVMSILYGKIGSIISQSSELLQTIQSSQVKKPAIPLTARIIIGKAPDVPHNSLATESSTCSPITFKSNSNYGAKKPVTIRSPDYGFTACSATAQSSLAEDEGTNVSLFQVCEILQRQDGNNTAPLHAQHEIQGHNVLRSRESAIRVLIIIVVTFAVCSFPYHLRRICLYYVSSYDISSSFNQLLTPVTFLLMYANCAVNPVLYAFLSKGSGPV